jgi:hypothetical protein
VGDRETDGEALGVAVGMAVGAAVVGALLGASDAVAVGDDETETVGCDEGRVEYVIVGVTEGAALWEGPLLRALLGAAVGVAEGVSDAVLLG